MAAAKTICDILVVGGGPAGSSLAWALGAAGMDVTVMDKAQFPRHKVCAGWITPAIIDELRLDMDHYAARHTWQPITGFNIGLVDGIRQVPVRYAAAVSYGIRRCEFDHYLLMRAGASLLTGEALNTLERRNGLWEVNGWLRTPMIVGAGGHFCPVARALGNRLGRGEAVVAAQEVEYEMTPGQRDECRVAPEVPELYFCRDLKGYGWCFRKGDYLNIGLGREDNRHLSDHVAAFYDFLGRRGSIPKASPPFKGHAYILYNSGTRTFVGDGALLVGDALGLAYAQSGEGIRPAIESALLAADVIVNAKGDYTRGRLAAYARRIEERFGGRGSASVGQGIPAGVKQALARRLIATRWFSRKVIMDRWFLHSEQQALTLGTSPS